jgi:hypothetical protein
MFSPSFDETSFPTINGDAGSSNFFRYGLSDLASLYRLLIFSHGCRDEDCLEIFVPSGMSSTMVIRTIGSPTTFTKLFSCFSWHTCVGTLADGY